MKAVIMAGGKGTRIASMRSDIPKPMIPVEGKPVLQYEIENLVENGITDIILVVGHLGDAIKDYFKNGSALGADISYYTETEPLGTAGALYCLKDKLQETFFLLNGDSVMSVDFKRMAAFHKERGGLATILTHPNSHPYDSALIVTGDGGCVKKWLSKEDERTAYKNRVNAGIHILTPEIVSGMDRGGKWDLDRDILRPLSGTGKLYAYDSPEYIKDMGTPERYEKVCGDVRSGLVRRKNLSCRQRAVFLDRDGTLNVYKGFITRPEQIELIDGTAEAIRAINDSGYLAIVVTNQPVIARGDCTFEELEEINNTLSTRLGEAGAYIDDLYFCPHHPDKGFEGERPEYKIECSCRKPKPGMLLEAAEKYNIDLKESYMVGDGENDMRAGAAAGCRCAYVGGKELKCEGISCERYDSLLDFVRRCIE